jgi:microcystin-dependent protein
MENYLGEIRIFAGNFAPQGWLFCQGQLLAISQNQALFALLGTTYGGDGQTTFSVPDLRGRAAVGLGAGPGLSPYQQGQQAGYETVTLTTAQLPVHQHPVLGSMRATTGTPAQASPSQAYFGDQAGPAYQSGAPNNMLAPDAVTGQTNPTGDSQAHSNIQPLLAINYIIALEGIFPSPS